MKHFKYLIRKRALGDVLWIEPVVRQLAKKFKRLVVYTKYPELFENFPFSNVAFKKQLSFFNKAIIVIEKKLNVRFLTINLDDAYEKRPNLHFLHAYQAAAGLPQKDEYPQLYLSQKEKEFSPVSYPYVIVHTESFSDKAYRQVFGIDWNAIVRFFREQGYTVVQVGVSPKSLEDVVTIKTTLRELLSLIYHASYFVGIDSGPSHIAASFGIPSMVLFGAINPCLRHFPEIFNGILLKQPCDVSCTTYDVATSEDHHCSALTVDKIPKCCIYSTHEVISQLKMLLQKHVRKTIE